MLHLCDVFQFIVYRFYNSPFPEKQPVRDAQQSPLHVTFEFCDNLYAINEQALEEVLADISFVRNQLAIYEFDKSLVFQWLPVIHIPRSYHEVQQFTLLIANQMQFEAKEPSHGTFASFSYTLEYFMNMYPLVLAYSQRSAVYETYARALSKQYLFDEQCQRAGHFFFKFHKTVVGNNLRE